MTCMSHRVMHRVGRKDDQLCHGCAKGLRNALGRYVQKSPLPSPGSCPTPSPLESVSNEAQEVLEEGVDDEDNVRQQDADLRTADSRSAVLLLRVS